LLALLAAGCAAGAAPPPQAPHTPAAEHGDRAMLIARYSQRVVAWRAPRKSGLREPDWSVQPPEWSELAALVHATPPPLSGRALAALMQLDADADRGDVRAAAADCRTLITAAVWSARASLECAMVDATLAHYPRARWLMAHALDLIDAGPVRDFARAKLAAWDGLGDGSSFYGEKEPCDLAGTACHY
jgi:hypothetical protein